MGEPSDQPPAHGELGEEIQRLVTAAQRWAQEWSRGEAGVVPPQAEPADPAPSCPVWCPICQFANVLRGEHPEVADRLADAGTAIANALRAFVDAAATRVSPPPAAEPAPERPRPNPGVQRIHLDDPTEP